MENTNNGTSSNSSSFESLSISDLSSFSSSSFPSPSSTLIFPRYPSYPKMAVGQRSLRPYGGDGTHHHFLDACHLCKKPIGGGRDIFMYRGDTPFCSEECRQEQIEIDEDDEKMASRSKKKMEKKSMGSSSPSKNEKIDVRVSGMVVAV